MSMTVAEMIERLQEMDQDAVVRLATQPNWPLQFEVRGVVTQKDVAENTLCDEHEWYNCEACLEDTDNVVWITEGGSCQDTPYAPRAVFEV